MLALRIAIGAGLSKRLPYCWVASRWNSTNHYDIRLKKNKFNDQQSELQTQLLDASLLYVPEYGWTKTALMNGAESLGWTSMSHGICKRGPIELVEHFIQTSTAQLSEELKSHPDFLDLKTTARIKRLISIRLMMTSPYIDKWPQALSLMGLPQNAPNTVKQLAELVDEIWFLAGDQSIDSTDFQDTFAFLDRRLGDVGTIGRGISEVSNMLTYGTSQVTSILKSKGIRPPF
ncbi:Ubiquinone biosynthesis protein coq9, mitochondrial [Globomyces sp. JEL0801]|nr:Ubiquinone biosynthesis protein coq9, mitochondrial [Globomyces sp. JEL0801]